VGLPFFARRFVAGLTADEAVLSVKPLNQDGISASLDILGENVSSKEAAEAACKDYKDLITKIVQEKLNANISIKLTMLGLDISDEFAEKLLMDLLEHSQKVGGIFVRIDMEGSPYTERTVKLFLKARAKYEHVGIVLQAYLYRTEADLKRVIDAKGRVRLCKGAYKEPQSIAFQDMADVKKNYMHLGRMLLKDGVYPAFATHDDLLINQTQALAKELKRDPKTFEFQMLYGLRPKTWRSIVQAGYNMRVYVPYGASWYPYFYRRLRERKENVFFIMRNLFKG
jgi:proline dehydrogenase